jgi:DNA helicase-2/ATP-dependent DNA helicase PcrA
MKDINNLPDITSLMDIERDFKIYAGPGSGKTTWLVSHLENVLRKSKRLGKTGRIACITYTNVAAEELISRLQCNKDRFDISTIHSFLYRNIIKPFSYHIEKDDQGHQLFDTTKLNGHEEHHVQMDKLRRWINTLSELHGKKYGMYNETSIKQKLIELLSSLDYAFINNKIELVVRKKGKFKLPNSNRKLWKYKSNYWHDGIMHHEDVLYFSYFILCISPRLTDFISNKYPYIFIDEFQDTTEVQTWIINKITELSTKVGVVGDLAQSIYEFSGAKKSDLLNFKDGKIDEYKISQNHRSTRRIIDFLNKLRPDISQEYGSNNLEGNPVLVVVGSIKAAIDWCKSYLLSDDITVLTRKNRTVAEISSHIEHVEQEDLLKSLYASDSNDSRVMFINSILRGCKFYKKNDLRNALNEIIKALKKISEIKILRLEMRRIAIRIIDSLKEKSVLEKSISEFYTELREWALEEYGITIGSGLRDGTAARFYKSHNVNDILPFVRVDTKTDDVIRTIHSAKGAEFKNSLLHFEETNDFRHYIFDGKKNINMEKDDGRIYYVGCSRAKNNLFINIPDINDDDIEKIVNMGIDYRML